MMFEIKQVQLKELLSEPTRNGLTKPKAIRGQGVPMIAMGEVFANNRIYSIQMERVPVTDKELLTSSIYDNDLLFARQSLVLEGAGKCCIVKEVNEPTVFESHLIRVRVDKTKALPDYIYYYFNSYQGRENIKTIVEQVAAAGIRGSDLVNLYIPIPLVTVQQQIVQVLMNIDDKIAVNTAINENLEQQAQAIYAQMFIESAEESWKTGSLSDIAVITMGQSPKGDTFNETGEGAVFYQGRTDFGFRFPTRRLYTTEPKRIALCGDALMSVRAPVGDLNVAYEECCIGRGLAAIHSKDNHQSFVLYTLFTLKKQLDVFNGEGTVFGSINKESLNSMEITIPPRALMDKFESIVSSIDRAIRNNYEEICRLQAIRDTLLPKLMNGEIDVSAVKI